MSLPLPSKLKKLASAARLALGLPDYETYLAHHRERHPGEAVMSYEEFFRARVAAKYGKGSTRCC